MTVTRQKSTPKTNEAGTPRQVFETLHREYGFTIDVCANEHNHKLDRYVTEQTDGLAISWHNERVWCNPPYANIEPWLAKAQDYQSFVALLLPVRSFNKWWRAFKPKVECHYFIGRMQFEPPEGVEYSSNPFPICLFVFNGFTGERYRDAKTGEYI